MQKVAEAFSLVLLTITGLFFFIIFNTLMGGIAGWCVGIYFGDTILGILSQLGIKNITMFQFGLFMGFTGGFLKTKVTAVKKEGA